MVLVLLGTQNNSFTRLLEEVEKNINNGNITDEVIVQAGYTKYQSDKMKIYNLVSSQEMENLVNKADLVISHGGVGSTLQCVKKGKVVIGVPRQKKYKEHVNDHQKQLIKSFDEQGYIIGISDVTQLEKALKKVKKFTPSQFKSNTGNIINIIENYIENN